jgi:peptidoglycan/LPS O-acetylase OafA/YrhL
MAKLHFANQLRGLAALFVLVSHWVGVFWAARATVGSATATPVQEGQIPGILPLLFPPWLNFGPFGVALFFLISGLVIPLGLGSHTRLSFILARGLRIYPTYGLGLALCVTVVLLNRHFWHLPVPFSWGTVLQNGLLLFDFTGRPGIDLVNWTLVIEMKFYLFMMLAAPAIRRGDPTPLFVLAVLALALNVGMAQTRFGSLPDRYPNQFAMAILESISLVFMGIGVLFAFHLRRQIATIEALLLGGMLLAFFAAAWAIGPTGASFIPVAPNYAYALALFALCYRLRRHFRPLPPLDGLAAISFPLYCIHALLGYSLLKALMIGRGLSYPAALAVTAGSIMVVATLLHLTVERWSINLARRLQSVPPPSRHPAPGSVRRLPAFAGFAHRWRRSPPPERHSAPRSLRDR